MTISTLEDPSALPARSIAEYPLPHGKLVLSLQGSPPRWVEPLLQRLMQLLAIPDNWDSYGGRTINPVKILAAWQLLARVMTEEMPLPSLVPTPRGNIQIEWHAEGIDLEIELTDTDRLVVSFEDAKTGETWDREFALDADQLDSYILRLQTAPSSSAQSDHE